ncbi:HEAT repeat domain-containing protein [Limnospira sp. PMC 1243.20]|uniref:HEAT repeat domain-containing protein n=1 Tax=Limnospira sp. PMC 1243.20 TaxID=2981041 RepID=UPI0028E0D4A8|nr:NACHT domain-containing protein [Limnospira sp. PMC 1243.20]MDT9204564.1 HEAT repeat domain-containing protein [Limnospira sp. PMC 1243.20]
MVGKSGQPFKKSRKYGESAEDLQDRLDFVAALLAWDDKEITIPPDSLKAQFELEWVKEDELRVSGILEQKQRNGQIKRIEKGITKKELGILLETYRQKPILEAARDELIQNALACLRDLGILKEHESAKNQGYWKFSLCLKHQTKREENLQVIRDKWKESFGELPEPNHPPQLTATLNRCILGLKGDYQKAQQQLTEITQTLQNLLKDKTLSITKVEEGSIILIVESSQTGYEQLKRLIGEEVAGFPVEYAIDEWQDICRRMLLDRKPLSSNTVIGQVYGNRNLIDEDLFVDLALVKPKRSENPKHPQEIDPEKGSDLYNREEVEKRFAYREFLQEVISQRTEKRLAIIGEPGAGKTTLLQKLAFWLLQETDDLVVWVSLAELGSQPLGEYLEQKWLTEALRQSREEIKADWGNKFEGGAVWLLLDGLDEMSQTDQQALKLRGWVTDARMIVTCRLNLWQGNPSQLQGFQTYLTQPFQDEQMQEFIRRWFRGLVAAGEDVQLAESLWSELQESGKERIKDLCRNPLRLTLLCATWKVEDALPETMADLYGGFVESVYGWKETAFPVTEKEKEQLNAALGELAKASLEGETSRFRLTHRLVCEHLGKPKAAGSLFPLALRLGWLNEVGVAAENRREKVYGFYHATFQEYFAALAVEDWDYFLPRNHVDCPVEGKRYRIFEKQWKQVILLWLGRGDIAANDKLEFVIKLATFNDKCRNLYRVKSLFLAVDGISQLKDIDMLIPYKKYDQFPLTSALIDKLVGLALWDFDVEPKRWSIYSDCFQKDAQEILKRTTRSKVVAMLELKINLISRCYLINHVLKGKTQTEAEAQFKEICPDPEMANLIANDMRCLEEMGIHVESTVNKGGKDWIFLVFVNFLWQLDPKNHSIASNLPFLIANTENPGSRLNAINWLLTVDPDHPALVEGLVKTMITALEWRDRDEAAQILGKVNPGNPFIMNWLLELLEANQNENSRWQIAYHLGLVDPGNIQAQAVLMEIVETTQNEDIRWYLANCLEKYEPGNSGAIAVLLKIIETANHKDIIRQAFQTLEEIGKEHPDTIAGLLKIIKTSKHEDIISQAIWILRKTGNTDIIADLLELIETTNHQDIINLAFWTLDEIGKGNPDAISGLLKLIETTENENIIDQAFWTLDEIGKGNPDAISGLLKIIETTDNKKIINKTFFTLWQIGKDNPGVIASLLKIIETTDNEDTRCQAASCLQKIELGNLYIIPALIRVIETTDNENTRYQAACSLHTIEPGHIHIIPALVKVLETTENEDFLYVAEYLYEIDPGNPHLIPALIRVVETTDNEDTCCEVAKYLYEIDPGNSHVIPALVRVIETTDNEDTAKMAVETFRNFELNHPEAISVLSKLIQSISNLNILEEVAYSLGIIDPGNLQAITTLINLAEISEEQSFRHYSYQFRKSWKGSDQAITRLLELLVETADHNTLHFAGEILEEIGKGNHLAISGLMKILQTNANAKIRTYAAYGLAEIDPKNYLVIPELLKALETNQEEYSQWQIAWELGKVAPNNQRVTECVLRLMETNNSHYIVRELDRNLRKIEWGSHLGISVIIKLLKISRDKPYEESPIYSLFHFNETFDGICHGSTLATSRLIELIQSDYLEGGYYLYFDYLKRTIANQKQKEMIISALHSHLSDETYTDNFNLYLECYKLFWDISQDLPYPDFYQAWHNPPITPHPEVTEQTPHSGEPSFASPLTWESLQHLPMYCLNADLLADETREREIALTLSELIWEITCPEEDPPEPATPAELRRHLKTLKRRNLLPHRAILFGSETVSTPTQPTPELMAFCQKLTGVIAIAFLTDDPLEAPLKGFPPNQRNLISAIETWLGEI